MTTVAGIVDPTQVGPDEFNASVNAALAEEPLKAPEPPETRITLPCGGGQAEVRELNGEDEEFFAKERWGESTGKMISSIIQRGTVSLNGEKPHAEHLRSLLVGDRLALFIGIRKATYGDDVPLSLTCPACRKEFRVAIELHDLPTKTWEGEPVFEVDLRNGGKAKVGLINGAVHEEMETAATAAEQNTICLARCIKYLPGTPFITLDIARRLGSLDRKNIIEALADKAPGPRIDNIEVPCNHCGEVSTVTLSVADLFRT